MSRGLLEPCFERSERGPDEGMSIVSLRRLTLASVQPIEDNPLVRVPEHHDRLGVRLPGELRQEVEAAARARRLSLAAYVRTALSAELERDPRRTAPRRRPTRRRPGT